MIAFWTYNLKDYLRNDTPQEADRYRLTEAVVRDAGPDVIAVQELPGHSQDRAEDALLRLSGATGMVCRLGRDYTGPVAAIRGGHNELALGIMWRPGIWADQNSLRVHEGPNWWHALVLVQLNVKGHWIWHGSYHAPPAKGGERRPNEALQVVEAMKLARPGLIGADWNNEYYYLDRAGSRLAEPPPGAALLNALDGKDRAAAGILCDGGLYDATVKLGTRRPVTTGHWPEEENGDRQIDAVLVTTDVVDAIRDRVDLRTDEARRASDHMPTGIGYDPTAI